MIVARYHKVNVIKSCGYYYPEVNGDVECKSIKEVKKWIEDVWLFVQEGLSFIDKQMDVPSGTSKSFMLSGFKHF